MKAHFLTTSLVVLATLNCEPVLAKTQSIIRGDSAQQVQENAFKKGMGYPIGELKCDQRCSQVWEKE